MTASGITRKWVSLTNWDTSFTKMGQKVQISSRNFLTSEDKIITIKIQKQNKKNHVITKLTYFNNQNSFFQIFYNQVIFYINSNLIPIIYQIN